MPDLYAVNRRSLEAFRPRRAALMRQWGREAYHEVTRPARLLLRTIMKRDSADVVGAFGYMAQKCAEGEQPMPAVGIACAALDLLDEAEVDTPIEIEIEVPALESPVRPDGLTQPRSGSADTDRFPAA